MEDERAKKYQRYAQVAEVFTPGAPIDRLTLFAGRLVQILEVLNAVGQRGMHVALYGERGVGKTSLANVLADIFTQRGGDKLYSVRVNCSTVDDFASLWKKVFRELEVNGGSIEPQGSAQVPDPDDIRYALQKLDHNTLVILDELDRLEDNEALSLLADTVKALSDHPVRTTLVLVGVADSIYELIGDHRSVERALTQVLMPPMSEDELIEIIAKGLSQLGMSISLSAQARIARLSEGLPHYTHALCLHAAQRAVMDDRTEINSVDVENAVQAAVDKTQASIKSAYQKATRSPRQDSLFAQVLLAGALAPKDQLGYFTASGVREPFSRIMGKRYEIAAFQRHLDEFSKDKRGHVLIKSGEPRSYFYKFENPLLQPFVILHGLSHDLITEKVVQELRGSSTPSDEELNRFASQLEPPS
jgi:Cdc6-like AAA superfamily ATPase